MPGETCTTGSSSISGLAFYTADAFPPAYKNALFFSDYSRNCIWVMYPGANGLPDPATRQTFLAGAAGPVFLTQGPDGALYYADLAGGTVRRVAADNNAPTARIVADPVLRRRAADGRLRRPTSSDPEGAGAHLRLGPRRRRRLRRLDAANAVVHVHGRRRGHRAAARHRHRSARRARRRRRSRSAPRRRSRSRRPRRRRRGRSGTRSASRARARNSAGATLPASSLRWALDMRHCSRTDATNCHTHHIQDYVGVASGSFVAPDHEYPSHLELSLIGHRRRGPEHDRRRCS